MRILYIYPHPDDESFAAAHVMHKQVREGHEVFLLTLTKGGATRQRFKYNYSVEEMGDVRFKEMQCVEKVLKLTGMKVLDLPDSGLKEMDPRDIEVVVSSMIRSLKPNVVVTYAVHGISGFHDHLVTHAVVKRVFAEMRQGSEGPRRLAMFTITEESAKKASSIFSLHGSKPEEIDCVVSVDEEDLRAAKEALDCYETFQETIEKSGIKNLLTKECYFELYREDFDPPLKDLFERL